MGFATKYSGLTDAIDPILNELHAQGKLHHEGGGCILCNLLKKGYNMGHWTGLATTYSIYLTRLSDRASETLPLACVSILLRRSIYVGTRMGSLFERTG